MPRRSVFFLLLFVVVSAGCERGATGPAAIEEARVRTLGSAPNTLPALFDEALRTAQLRNGATLNTALATWEAHQAEVHAAYAARDPVALQARLQALRNEEIKLILTVLGRDVVTRAVRESNAALAEARLRITEAAAQGAQTDAAEAAAREISELLSHATALQTNEPGRALPVVAEAARLLATIDDAIVDLRRLRGVETLFPELAAKLEPEALRTHARLQGAAQNALREGERSVARERLEAVRAEEIRLVLQASDERACEQLIGQVAAVIGELRNRLDAADERDGDVLRLERMLATAHDLYQQARHAEAAGDHAKALDLGSHAAGLLNSMRHLLVK